MRYEYDGVDVRCSQPGCRGQPVIGVVPEQPGSEGKDKRNYMT